MHLVLGLILLVVLALTGCQGMDLTPENVQTVAEGVIVCDPPYIRFAAGCCLDANENKICDQDEGLIVQPEEEEKVEDVPPEDEEEPAEDLLRLTEGFGLVRGIIAEGSPLLGTSLSESALSEKGLLVLGIERGHSWIPTPRSDERLSEGDRVVVYGPLNVLRSLFRSD